jgi:Mg2+/Co2+ transporter CorB
LDNLSVTALSFILLGLIILSAFFSSSETSLLSLNKYRLKSLVKKKHRGALLTQKLLDRPDRLISLILIGNNLVNFVAASIATAICIKLWGSMGAIISPIILTFVVLIFAEITPKTLAALHPEKIAFPAAFVLTPLYKLLYIVIIGLNTITNGLLRLIGVKVDSVENEHLDSDELRVIVNEASALIPKRHQNMLLSILDLEKVTVEDIMVPRNEISGIDLDSPIEQISQELKTTQHTRLPVYKDEIDKVEGFLHVRQMIGLLSDDDAITKQKIVQAMTKVYFIPEGTPLNTQLLNFQRKKLRIGLVVDEYGDIQGLVTLEDILEEIVGEFTTDMSDENQDIEEKNDGSIIIDGSATIRDINRSLDWELPTDGPKTLNGLIVEYVESIPQAGTGMRLSGYPMEILHTKSNRVKSVRVWPGLYKEAPDQ